MFCPECGKPLPDAAARFCAFCGKPVVLPPDAVLEMHRNEPAIRSVSKRCTAALLLGTGTFIGSMTTLICRILETDLRVLGAVSAATFFLAPLACVFGAAGIAARIGHPEKRGLFRASAGLLLGLIFGALAAYCVLKRMLLY